MESPHLPVIHWFKSLKFSHENYLIFLCKNTNYNWIKLKASKNKNFFTCEFLFKKAINLMGSEKIKLNLFMKVWIFQINLKSVGGEREAILWCIKNQMAFSFLSIAESESVKSSKNKSIWCVKNSNAPFYMQIFVSIKNSKFHKCVECRFSILFTSIFWRERATKAAKYAQNLSDAINDCFYDIFISSQLIYYQLTFWKEKISTCYRFLFWFFFILIIKSYLIQFFMFWMLRNEISKLIDLTYKNIFMVLNKNIIF